MRNYPLVEFPGSIAIALDEIVSVEELDLGVTFVITRNKEVHRIEGATYDECMVRYYKCISLNEETRQ
jgi:hypothetical protein